MRQQPVSPRMSSVRKHQGMCPVEVDEEYPQGEGTEDEESIMEEVEESARVRVKPEVDQPSSK